jgi:hypothetical protein
MSLTKAEFHFRVYYLSLCLLVISLPTSRFMITVSLILLGANWVAEENLREKFRLFWNNRPALAFSFIYVVHLIGLFWTRDLNFALPSDLLHKLPTLFMPLILVSSPLLNAKKIRSLLFLFAAAVMTSALTGWIMSVTRVINDFRETSPFISNIYFSMMVIIAAFYLPELIKQTFNNRIITFAGWFISALLILFLLYSRSLSGIASLAAVSVFALIRIIIYHNNLVIKVLSVIFLITIIGTGLYVVNSIYELTHKEIPSDFGSLDTHSIYGTPYNHDTLNIQRENGHLVYLHIAEKELEEAWNERSKLNFYEKDKLNHELRYTLYRYMASKGLRKDREGLNSLTGKDIQAVERGVTNYKYLEWPGIYIRLHQMMTGLFVYHKTGYINPGWSTLTERMELWKASMVAFKEYPVFGWGTGSIMQAMDYGKQKNNSALIGRDMKPHNQYFYTLLSVGVVGLACILLLFSYFAIKSGVYRFFYFWIMIIVFGIHFIGNNSIESQLGQNLFVFFALYYGYFYPKIYAEGNFIN